MIRIANLSIPPDAPEYLPGSLARDLCVLPLGLHGNALRVVFGRRRDYRESMAMLRFVLNRPIIAFVADHARVSMAIDEMYGNGSTTVENCPLDFRFECPRRWLSLRPTKDGDIRFCEGCRREVFLCRNEDEAVAHAQHGRCVAIRRDDEDDGSLLGSLLIEVPDEPTP